MVCFNTATIFQTDGKQKKQQLWMYHVDRHTLMLTVVVTLLQLHFIVIDIAGNC